MKRLLTVFLAGLLCLGLAACGGTDEMPPTAIRNAETGVTLTPGMTREEVEKLLGQGEEVDQQRQRYESHLDFLARYHADDEDYEIPTYEEYTSGYTQVYPIYDLFTYGENEDTLQVRYEEGIATELSAFGPLTYQDLLDQTGTTSSNWHLYNGLAVGNSREDITNALGNASNVSTWPITEDMNVTFFYYTFDAEGNQLFDEIESYYFTEGNRPDNVTMLYDISISVDDRNDTVFSYSVRSLLTIQDED